MLEELRLLHFTDTGGAGDFWMIGETLDGWVLNYKG